MFAWIKPHLTLLALGALTGGTAYAANTIFSDDIVDGQVKTADLAGGTVTVAKLADASVTGAKVKDATLSGPDVLDNSLKGADIDESTLSGVGGGGAPEAWHNVAAGSSSSNRCDDPSATAVFCVVRM